MPDDDTRKRLIEALLSPRDMYEHIARTPGLREPWLAGAGQPQPAPPTDAENYSRILGEAGAMGDPFGILGFQRLLGRDIPTRARINEAHGLANKERMRNFNLRDR